MLSRTTVKILLSLACLFIVGMLGVMLALFPMGCAKPWAPEAWDRAGDKPSHHDNLHSMLFPNRLRFAAHIERTAAA